MIAKLMAVLVFISAVNAYAQIEYSVSACAVTPKQKINGRIESWGGHMVMILKGACRDQEVNHPHLKTCERPEGVMVSVNGYVKNVNWIAIDDADFGLKGGLKPNDVVTPEVLEHLLDKALASGAYRGVEIHDKFISWLNGDSVERFVAKMGLTTDYALTTARTAVCTKIPVTKEIISSLVDHLNGLNEKYYQANLMNYTEGLYNWDILQNNCAHLVHNALATLGIWKPKKTNAGINMISNLAIPANEAIKLAETIHDLNLNDSIGIYNNKILCESFLKYKWLPSQAGALVELHFFQLPNEVFKRKYDFFIWEAPVWKNITRLFEKLLKNETYSDVEMNKNFYQDKYKFALNFKPTIMELRRRLKPGTPEEIASFERFYTEYERYLQAH